MYVPTHVTFKIGKPLNGDVSYGVVLKRLVSSAPIPSQYLDVPVARQLCLTCFDWTHPKDLRIMKTEWIFDDMVERVVESVYCLTCRKFFSTFTVSGLVGDLVSL